MLQRYAAGFPLPGWSGGERHPRCVFATRIKKRKWPPSQKRLQDVRRKSRILRGWGEYPSQPKIGADWQRRASKNALSRRGKMKNIIWPVRGTGKVSYIGCCSKKSGLFISLLKHLKSTYRRAKTITLIVDNYIIHKSRETLRWLKKPKFIVIYQTVYSPRVNHIERLWQALHDTITRNHSCRSMWQLLNKVRHFMKMVSPFPGGKHGQAKV